MNKEVTVMEERVRKLQACVYILIVLVFINTIMLIVSLGDPSDSKTATASNSEDESYSYDTSMFKEISADEYFEELKKDELQVVYMGRPTCGYCIRFLPNLQQAQKEYGYTTLYIDTDEITSDDLTKVLSTMGLEISTFGTPTTVLIKNGEVIDKQIGYSEYSTFASMLEKNGFTK